MRRVLAILMLLLPLSASAQRDSLFLQRMEKMDSLLTRFYTMLEREDNESKIREFDMLIATCGDSLTRQHVAMSIIDHFSRHSRVMGEETVAIELYDRWVATGIVKSRDEFEQMNNELFVNFNRKSLVGMQAPEIELIKPCGGKMKIPAKGKTAILFFYDTSCGKCRLEAQLMPTVLKDISIPVNFYAIYAGTERKEWNEFRRNFRIRNGKIRVIHLWDPDIESDYQRMYGVIGTPRLFVLLEDGEIFGRKLEVDNLLQIFHYIEPIYGKKEEN